MWDNFFNRSTEKIAKELLGRYLVRRRGKKIEAYKIVETEAYVGPQDKANHAYRGRTKRTEVMFGEAGHWYVYLCYGMHHMLNIVTGPKDYPAAVLIRGVVKTSGPNIRMSDILILGPGLVTKALRVGTSMNGKRASKTSGLWIEDRGERVNLRDIVKTSRIGVAYAEEWKDKPLRFVLKDYLPRKKNRGTKGE